MELRSQINTILAEIPGLWQCLKHNTYPESFLINAMGFQPETCGRLPQILILFLGFYLVCAIATLGLRFGLKQRSLCSIPQQVGNAAVVCCGIPLTRLLIFLSKACFYIVGNKVAPLQRGGKEGDFSASSVTPYTASFI